MFETKKLRVLLSALAACFVGSMVSANTLAPSSGLVNLKCYSAYSEKPLLIFSGYLRASQIQFSATAVSIVGRQRSVETEDFSHADCSHTYMKSQWSGSLGKYVQVSANREWNAIKVDLKNSTNYLNCNPTSVLEVFDSAHAWMGDLRSKYLQPKLSSRASNQISNDACLFTTDAVTKGL